MTNVTILHPRHVQAFNASGPAEPMNAELRGLIARALRKNRLIGFVSNRLDVMRKADPQLAQKWEIPGIGGCDALRVQDNLTEFMTDLRNAVWYSADTLFESEDAVTRLDLEMIIQLEQLVEPTPMEKYLEAEGEPRY